MLNSEQYYAFVTDGKRKEGSINRDLSDGQALLDDLDGNDVRKRVVDGGVDPGRLSLLLRRRAWRPDEFLYGRYHQEIRVENPEKSQ